MSEILLRVTAVATLALLAAAPCFGAGGSPATAPAAKAIARDADAATPIKARDIPTRADADEQFVRDAIGRSKYAAGDEVLEARLDELAASARDLADTLQRTDLLSLPVTRLESIERHWNFHSRQFDDWKRDQLRTLDSLTEDAAQLATRRTAWGKVHSAESAEVVAPALLERVDRLLQELDAAQHAVSAPLSAQLELAARGSSLAAAIESGKRAVSLAIDNYDRRLFRVDSPRYWDLWHQRGADTGALGTLAAGLAVESNFLREYAAASSERINVYAISVLLLFPFLLWLSARSQKLVAADPALRASTQTLTRPVSAWLVLALVGTLMLLPDAPVYVHQLALLLSLIPVLRLLPQHVYDVFGPWPYAATVLYVAKRVGFLLVGNPFWHRTHLLVVTLLALAGLVWMLLQWQHRPPAPNPAASRMRAAARAVGWFGVALLAVSVAANLFGNATLAEVLTTGTLNAGYLGLALYAGATALSAVIRLLFAKRTSIGAVFLARDAGRLVRSLTTLVRIAAAVVWVVVTLNVFRIYRPVAEAVSAVLTWPIEAGKISITLGSILLFVLGVWVAVWISRTIRMTLNEEVLPKMSLPRGLSNTISTLSYYAILTLGLLIALAAAGFQVSQLAIVVGALGVGIGFGLQNVVNNFVSGLILMFERPIQPGDSIDVAGVSGTVREIGMRATTLIGAEGADIIVPNGTLLSEKLVNWTLSNQDRRIEVTVGVAYGNKPRRVIELLAETATATPGIAKSPAPNVLFLGSGLGTLNFSLRAWAEDFDNWGNIRSDLNVRVHEALAAEGIEIPVPQQDLNLKSVSPAAAAQLAEIVTARAAAPKPAAPAATPAVAPKPAAS